MKTQRDLTYVSDLPKIQDSTSGAQVIQILNNEVDLRQSIDTKNLE